MLIAFGAFCCVSMAGHTFGKILSPLGFPSITLFIFFGLLAGPVGFELVSTDDVKLLDWISDMALGFIGLSAGGHFHVSEMTGALGPALTILTSLVIITYSGCLITILLLGDYFIPFFGALDYGSKFAAALLIACLSVARSPSSAIAIISELNAKGPFTTVVLAVTVLMDVVVVVTFSITLLVAGVLDSSPSQQLAPPADADSNFLSSAFGRIARQVLVEFSSKVLLSALLGVVLGHALPLLFGWNPPAHAWPQGRNATIIAISCAGLSLGVRTLVVLLQRASLPLAGWLLFFEEEMSEELHLSDWLNPLICTMVAGFTIVNYTQAGKPFHDAIESISGPIYLLFFLYTGASMDVYVLMRNLPASLLIFCTRASLIVISTYLGGVCAAQPHEFNTRYWMAFLTQAGVTLGLAQSASAHFAWGPDFNATIVAVSVINQVVGPPLMKQSLRLAGEAHHNYVPKKFEEINGVGGIGAIGKANLPLTGRPQPRGALVIAEDIFDPRFSPPPALAGRQPDGKEASLIVSRLRARGWEVLVADEKLSVSAMGSDERRRIDRTASTLIDRLPAEVRDEVKGQTKTSRPWDSASYHHPGGEINPGRVVTSCSTPDMSAYLRSPARQTAPVPTPVPVPSPGAVLFGRQFSRDSSGESCELVEALAAAGSINGGSSAKAAATSGGSPPPLRLRSLSASSLHTPTASRPPGVAVGTDSPTEAPPTPEVPSSHAATKQARNEPARKRRASKERRSRDLGGGSRLERRANSFGRAEAEGRQRSKTVAELLGPPEVPSLPEDPTEDPLRYAQCVRLLWLAASMKSFDVVVCMLSTDDANIAMCEMIGDMVPMLQFTRKRDPSPPQVVVALSEDATADAHVDLSFLTPQPLIIPRLTALASLVCEVLHPAAHWSGSLEAAEREEPEGASLDASAASSAGASAATDEKLISASDAFSIKKFATPSSPRRSARGGGLGLGRSGSAPNVPTPAKSLSFPKHLL